MHGRIVAMTKHHRLGIAVSAILVAIAAVTAYVTWYGLPVSRAPVTYFAYSYGGFGDCEWFFSNQVRVADLTVTTQDACPSSIAATRNVSQQEMDQFLAALDKSPFRRWRSHYADLTIVDGGGFRLIVEYADGTKQMVDTLNKEPPGMAAFRDALDVLGIR